MTITEIALEVWNENSGSLMITEQNLHSMAYEVEKRALSYRSQTSYENIHDLALKLLYDFADGQTHQEGRMFNKSCVAKKDGMSASDARYEFINALLRADKEETAEEIDQMFLEMMDVVEQTDMGERINAAYKVFKGEK